MNARLHPLALLQAALVTLALIPATLAAQQRPNIVFIMADDLGYGDIGSYGQETLATPRIDQLADEGLRFTSFYSGNTVCRPARLSLWAGLDSRHTAIRGNQYFALPEDTPSIPRILKDAGYQTGGVGKWSLFHQERGHPNDVGFDHWFGYLDQSLAHNHFPPHLWRNRDKVLYPDNKLATGNPDYLGRVSREKNTWSHAEMTDEALAFIRQSAGSPFLLHVHWTVPHANNEAGRTLGDGMEVPDYGSYAERDWPAPEKGFAAMIEKMDTDVGRIVDLVDSLGLAGNTLVIFTSDNGPHREGAHSEEFFDSNGPLRGYKRDLYEGGIRVPFIARWPGVVPAGARNDFPSAAWDLLPTFCEFAQAPIPAGLDGISLLPALRGETQRSDRTLHWRFEESDFVRSAIRYGKWKAVQPNSDTPWELYDLSTDIGETAGLAARHPDVLQRILSLP